MNESDAAHFSHVFHQKQRVLLVEDEEFFARAVVKRLNKAGLECEIAGTLGLGRAMFKQFDPDLVLLDIRLPDGSGMELLPEFLAKGAAVIVMTAHGDLADAVNAMKQGATDYLKKPIDLEELLLVVTKAQRTETLIHQLDYSRQRDQYQPEATDMLGDSSAMQAVQKQIKQIARLSALSPEAPPTILISGETGTGKDVAARLLHQLGDRADKPFVHVDCASLPAELMESELFGHEKGAFTNAQMTRCGLIEAAEDGTLFLNEVGELPINLQAKLLNVLERRVVRRLGSTKEHPVAAHFMAATNRDLQQMVLERRFRSDLYYRLNVLTLVMPPLSDRGDDVLQLAKHFLLQTERRYGLAARTFSQEAAVLLQQYAWPGNVRELKHLISRAALLCQGSEITSADISLQNLNIADDPLSMEGLTLPAAERRMLEDALSAVGGNVSKAARKLGLTRMAMRYRIEKHGIQSALS